MARVLITGMSGVGKSSVVALLGDRGVPAIDTDYGSWKTQDGLWDVNRMTALIEGHPDLAVAGTVENQGYFYDRFDHVVLLSAPEAIILERVQRRATNPYGSREAERTEIRENLRSVEPLLRRGATLELDATRPLVGLVGEIMSLVRP
ncbi:AAA family ATPase [Microbacterium sp. Leaf320]|uniref:AAA family ATPase n=1 Tax=Microbacterium sp. Leaf320 TaxID=1736334 RepID=UPI0006F8C6E6|nr:AAA family ATPase [Microbacterium sp. Leaf320]KQQ67090.1 ATP-binding protein [Microbacterium sp. Leaf320]